MDGPALRDAMPYPIQKTFTINLVDNRAIPDGSQLVLVASNFPEDRVFSINWILDDSPNGDTEKNFH